MTERDLQNALYYYTLGRNHRIRCPNVCCYPWESDLLSVTAAGLVHEYDFYSALVAFGAEEWITASGGGYTRDKWKQFDELSGTTEDRKYRMGMMMSCIVPKMKSLLVNNMSFDPSLGRADAERTFQFFGYNKNDIDAIRSKVAEEIPEPKAWAAQEEAESACALEEKPKRLSSKKKSKK